VLQHQCFGREKTSHFFVGSSTDFGGQNDQVLTRDPVRRNAPRRGTQEGLRMQHLDQKALADRWLVSPRTLEQWRWQGRGPRYLKIGGRVVYRQQDIEAFEAANLHANTVSPIRESPDEDRSHAISNGLEHKVGADWAASCAARQKRDGRAE
jgi:hypothetical protein